MEAYQLLHGPVTHIRLTQASITALSGIYFVYLAYPKVAAPDIVLLLQV